MKRLLFSLMAMSVVSASGQVAQSGTAAVLETARGKMPVFLQSLEDGVLTFQPRNSKRTIPGPVDKIKGLEFFPKYDLVAAEHSFKEGDYETVVAILERPMKDYWEYMAISNNVRPAFGMLVQAYLATDNLDRAKSAGEALMVSSDPKVASQGYVYSALAALGTVGTNGVVTTNALATAEQLSEKVESDAAKLYLQACISRAKGEYAEASWTVAQIIAEHGNDLDWMPSSELLSAELYLEQAFTNSASLCARQVASIYMGSNIGRDAEKLREQLPEIVPEEPKEEPEAAEEPEAEESVEAAEADATDEAEQGAPSE